LLVLLNVAADWADLNVGDQTDYKVYVQVFHCVDICLHISLIVFTVPSWSHVFAWTLRKAETRKRSCGLINLEAPLKIV
jgi:hypothetical protein